MESTAVQADGTIVLGGITDGDWSGANTGGFDIGLVALDADGEEIWRWQVTYSTKAAGFLVCHRFVTERAPNNAQNKVETMFTLHSGGKFNAC